jgi:hypothetical protein
MLAAMASSIGRVVGIVLLALVVIAGLVGPRDGAPKPRQLPRLAVLLAGVPILVIALGDVWRFVDPWRAVRSEASTGQLWPAVAAFAGFAWFDLASGRSNEPRLLALAALLFSAFVLVPVPFRAR